MGINIAGNWLIILLERFVLWKGVLKNCSVGAGNRFWLSPITAGYCFQKDCQKRICLNISLSFAKDVVHDSKRWQIPIRRPCPGTGITMYVLPWLLVSVVMRLEKNMNMED